MATRNYNESFNMERNASGITTIKADGTIVTTTYADMIKERAKQKRAEKKAKRAKKTTTLIELSKEQAIKLIKNVKVIKSLCAYYDHGYRQWGNICKVNIIDNPLISPSFNHLRVIARDLDKQIALIDAEGKRSKDTFQLIEKMSYLVDDISKEMNSLSNAIIESRVCEFFKDHEMIFGEGRRLGLAILCQRTMLALMDMQNIFKEINQISVEGADISDYNPNGSFSRF